MECKVSCLFDSDSVCHLKKTKMHGVRKAQFFPLFVLMDDWKKSD